MSPTNPINSNMAGPIGSFQTAHQAADTDLESVSLHHTLGSGPQQAAPGNHDHNVLYQTLADLAVIKNHRCRAKKTDNTTQSITSGMANVAKVSLDTTEYDPVGMFNNANDRIIIPADGVYSVTGTTHWQDIAGATGLGTGITRMCFVALNGNAIIGGNGLASPNDGTNNHYSNASTSCAAYFVANDYLELWCGHDDTAALNVEGWNASGSRVGCYLTVVRYA